MSIVSLIALVLLVASVVWALGFNPARSREISATLLAVWAIAVVVVLSGIASLGGPIVLR